MSIFKVAEIFAIKLGIDPSGGSFRRDPEAPASVKEPELLKRLQDSIEPQEPQAVPKPEEEYGIHPETGKKIKKAPPSEVEFGSPEYLEMERSEIKHPAVENYELAMGITIMNSAQEKGLTGLPEVVYVTIDGEHPMYWYFDSGNGQYKKAEGIENLDVSSKEFTQLIRALSGAEPAKTWRQEMYGEKE
ncbi:hypothetical protein LCGC14_0526320 [marine sediment metagenome]|uniref:Uncharacterized protein n=1 Tax=marine sediment metagenome TaxID=412755 RepID=A0A0F9SFE4_9ZZZZ